MSIDTTHYPQGLIGLMGLRGSLLTPTGLSETIAPTVDLFQFYIAGRQELLVAANVAAAVGTVVFPELLVPSGEIWYVSDYSIGNVNGAGVLGVVKPAMQPTPVQALGIGAYVSFPASATSRADMDRPRFLGPGAQLGYQCQSVTGAMTCSGNALITRLKV